jgi:hypothetical protein
MPVGKAGALSLATVSSRIARAFSFKNQCSQSWDPFTTSPPSCSFGFNQLTNTTAAGTRSRLVRVGEGTTVVGKDLRGGVVNKSKPTTGNDDEDPELSAAAASSPGWSSLVPFH